MRIKHSLDVIDTHTEGEPTRLLLNGLPPLVGSTVAEKRDDFKTRYDDIRRALLWEPRGHRDMFGAVLTPPASPRAQIGGFFLDSEGYLDMCGHASIGLIVACFEKGILSRQKPRVGWNMDTPAGLISFRPEFKGEKIASVTVQNVPSFLFKGDFELEVPGLGQIKADIAYGGNFFLLVKASEIGLKLSPQEIRRLIATGMSIREAGNRAASVVHPLYPECKQIDLVEIYEDVKKNGIDAQNIVIFGKGQYDRSPCGTGTSAKMAVLYAKRLLNLNTPYVQEGILGTCFTGRLVTETVIGGIPAVVPEITGRAWITGFNHIIMEVDDPFSEGFLLP